MLDKILHWLFQIDDVIKKRNEWFRQKITEALEKGDWDDAYMFRELEKKI